MASAAGRRSWTTLGVLAFAAAGRTACSDDDPPDAAIADVLAAVLADVWPHVLQPTLTRADAAAAALADATAAWRDDPDPSRQALAQVAWRDLLGIWQEIELYQVGPLGASATVVGGQDLREFVYAWPLTNPCRVDQETVAGAFADPAFFDTALSNVVGLGALETLLFAPAGVNACPPQVDINADGSWDALGEEGVQTARAAYAAALAADVADSLLAIRTAWSPSSGDYAGTLATAGAAGSPYESPDAALNALFDALFYLDQQTRDAKLGAPLGRATCGQTDCIEGIETPLSGDSHRWIASNLVGFRTLYTGGDGVGMDDLLDALGRSDVDDAMTTALDAADDAAAALTVPVDEALSSQLDQATALHDALTVVVDLLKGDVATVLVLTIPTDAAGDLD